MAGAGGTHVLMIVRYCYCTLLSSIISISLLYRTFLVDRRETPHIVHATQLAH